MKIKQKTNIIIIFLFCVTEVFLILLIFFNQKDGFKFFDVNNISNKNYGVDVKRSQNLIYGTNIDMSQLLPSSPYYVKNSDGEDLLDIAHRLGINALRISSVLKSFPEQDPDALYTQGQWTIVLDKMQRYGIKAVIIAETYSSNKNIYNPVISEDFLQQVKKYIIDSGVGDHPAVYLIDIKNEPILTSHNLSMLKREVAMIKQRYPNIKLTVGGWRAETNRVDGKGNPEYRWNEPQDAAPLSDIVDVYSPHIYNFDRKVGNKFPDATKLITDYLNQLETIAKNKPILIGEFGASNEESVSDQNLIGSKELQANTYYAVYNVLNNYEKDNILGSISYVMLSRNQYPDSWAIIKDKGDYIYPAAFVLQQFSLGKSDTNQKFPFENVPDDIVVSNEDYKKTNNGKVGDIVLFSLQINKDNTLKKDNKYQLVITPPDSLEVIEKLGYNTQFSSFNEILRIKKAGKITISFEQLESCSLNKCTPAKYSLFTSELLVR